mgnify:CR=1 FL=1
MSQTEAEARLKQFGENKLRKKKEVRWLRVLLFQFKSPLIYVLVIASGVTLVLGDVVNAAVIGAAVALNTILGFYQEIKAEKSLEALSKMLTPKAKVIRGGERQMIEASQVVAGDICILEIGERVPGDGEIIEADSLSLNEAVLTGESEAVKKHIGDEVFMGTTVSSGIARMRVKKTGPSTALGAIAESLIGIKEEPTPLQKQLARLAKKLAVMVGIICLAIFGAGLLAGKPLVEIFITAVALAVSAIPEGLAVALTVVLAIGMQRIFKRKALVRRLVVAETLGGVTVICVDKTGTLTEGKMTVIGALTTNEVLLRKAAVLCNDMRDPLETAMNDWARHAPQQPRGKPGKPNNRISESSAFAEQELVERLDTLPFDPKKKYIATLHQSQLDAGQALLLVSGAPEVILNKSGLSEKEKQEWLEKLITEAKKGHRLVGFAYKEINCRKIKESEIENLKWLGCLVYEDPLRKGVKEALMEAKRAGIKVKVITGDYRHTAEAIMNKLSLQAEELKPTQIMEGYELEKLSSEELDKRIEEVVLFCRTSPEQKLRIVEALQDNQEVVAMTGDGVNDAPAIKKADIGIVVEGASAVAQETADMVLLDSNFSTIIGAVEEGRNIFINLKKIVLYLMSDTFSEIILVIASVVLGLPLAITASQILWINLIVDFLPYFA